MAIFCGVTIYFGFFSIGVYLLFLNRGVVCGMYGVFACSGVQTSLTSGGRSVGIVRLRTEATEFFDIQLPGQIAWLVELLTDPGDGSIMFFRSLILSRHMPHCRTL
jgi:hypothetical protein